MNILVVTNMWPGQAEPTRGIFVSEQVDSLRARGHAVEVLHLDTPRRRWRYLSGIPQTLLSRARRRPDVIHAHYGLTAAIVAVAGLGAATVGTFHGSDVFVPWQRQVSRMAARLLCANICVSEAVRRQLGRDDAQVVPCGVDLALFRPRDQRQARARLGLPADEPLVLFAGARTNDVKNWPLLERSLPLMPARPQVLELAGVARADVPWLLNAVDALALVSKHEGSPMVLKEALACGLPVVAVPVGDVPERLAEVEGCQVVPADPAAVAAALSLTLTQRRRLPPGGVDALGLDAVAARLETIYERVAKC